MDFKIILDSEFWDDAPRVRILTSGQEQFLDFVKSESEIAFQVNDNDMTEVSLEIELLDKNDKQTVVKDGVIIKDQLLTIKEIIINGISLDELIFSGIYEPAYNQDWFQSQCDAGDTPPKFIQNVNCLGHNGTWRINFTLPFHIWYLENLP